jgi:hypothetical protein
MSWGGVPPGIPGRKGPSVSGYLVPFAAFLFVNSDLYWP